MDDSSLREALRGVENYFFGPDLNVNTVLAAHLRAAGVPASGVAWKRAKEALEKEGVDFAAAAAAGRDLARTGGQAANRVSSPAPLGVHPSPPGSTMSWFPKPFSPGDLDGLGARRLLGTPNIEPSWVLVRETGQNSWDARGGAPRIEFTLNLRPLSDRERSVLDRDIFTGAAPGTGLRQLLARKEVWVLEVSDRGTVGLGGPVRNDRAVPTGVATDFIDLVFNIGAPRDVHLGAGTYGFGKTISYSVSSVGAILLWSRPASDPDSSRLIGSAIGDSFDREGLRYTGRHWWGRITEDDRIEPLVGPTADELARRVFAAPLDPDTSGTSIMVLDPQLGGEDRESDANALLEAVVWNLWPKLLADSDGRPEMSIRVQLDGEDLIVPAIEDHPILGGAAACLRAVRAVQDGRKVPSAQLPLTVDEVRSERPKKLLGHLAMAKYPYVPHEGVRPWGDGPAHHVTFMRHQAELVVKYLDRAPIDVDGFQWIGVFKPVEEVDDSFADAEPPAHDDWVPASVTDKAQRRDVNVALRRIQQLADRFARPADRDATSTQRPRSTAIIGDLLADLVSPVSGSAPSRRRTTTGRAGKRAARPRPEIVGTEQTTDNDGWTVTDILVRLRDAGDQGALIEVRARVGYDGGSEDDPEFLTPLGWVTGGQEDPSPAPAHLSGDEIGRYRVRSAPGIAIDIDATVAGGR